MKTISPNLDNITILTELYCEINEFIKVFQPIFEKHLIGARRRVAFCRLSICEIMTILVAYQIIGGQNFKSFYKDVICQFNRSEFLSLVVIKDLLRLPQWLSFRCHYF